MQTEAVLEYRLRTGLPAVDRGEVTDQLTEFGKTIIATGQDKTRLLTDLFDERINGKYRESG